MKLNLNILILLIIFFLSGLSIKYTNNIVSNRLNKRNEIYNSLETINYIEGIQSLDLDSFLSSVLIKEKIITNNFYIYIYEYNGYDYIYLYNKDEM